MIAPIYRRVTVLVSGVAEGDNALSPTMEWAMRESSCGAHSGRVYQPDGTTASWTWRTTYHWRWRWLPIPRRLAMYLLMRQP